MKPTFALALSIATIASVLPAAEPTPPWPGLTLLSPSQVELRGPVGASLRRGLDRLAQPPYTTDWLLADVSFKVNRIFTNYSGDVSGRFIELATLTSPPGQPTPKTLPPVLAAISQYQKPDGHFGLDIDLAQPLKKLSTPIPMLWGNARLLVGLVAAAREFNDPALLAAARRLGQFYVTSADQLCAPARESELRATGTGGDGYTCCYFPAIESLALLYRATLEPRYLQQARQMADWFKRFDALPTDHSHGNLCAWRGILELYQLTGERDYLDRTLAKWQNAVQNGFVWTLGGVGEHWYVFHQGDEGCSESDWLRLNLELWRATGQTRFLDMAERLLHNQYLANQCPNGGFGWRNFDGDASGPIGTHGSVDEWNFCCSFHGPLGLHFLKTYFAAVSTKGVFVNFPLDFSAPIKAHGRDCRVTVRTLPEEHSKTAEIELAPLDKNTALRTVLWIRKPDWATDARVTTAAGAPLTCSTERGYLRLERDFKAGEPIRVAFQSNLRLEQRRFQPVAPEPGKVGRFHDVALLNGPDVLFATPAPPAGRLTLLARMDGAGRLEFPAGSSNTFFTVTLPTPEIPVDQIAAWIDTAKPVVLQPESALHTRRRAVFMHDLLVLPPEALLAPAVARFAARARSAPQVLAGPFIGEKLELQPDLWITPTGWQFSTNGLRVTGGDIGLLDGEGYADYRFEFDLQLPPEGQGIAGWVVRAQSPNDCVHFQLQSTDSPYHAPQFKTRPNTLRPHVRRAGEWTIADPVPLPMQIRRGETHHLAVECRGAQIVVFLDSRQIHAQNDAGFHAGTVGFRAGGPPEQGLFKNISLRQLRSGP